MLETEDFAGLEALAARLKSNGYDIEQQSPELNGFYWGLGVPLELAAKNVWTDRMKVLEKWRAAYPKSMSALLAEVNWYIDYSQTCGSGTAGDWWYAGRAWRDGAGEDVL